MKSEMLTWLNEYLTNTPKEVIVNDWKQIQQMDLSGPVAFEYVDFLHQKYSYLDYLDGTFSPIEIPKNMTPNFSESFFLLNLV